MRFIVISLGVLLFCGMGLLGFAIWQKATSNPASRQAQGCEPAILPVEKGARIVQITPRDGRVLFLLLEYPDKKQEVMAVDYCTGRRVSQLTLP